MPPKPHPPIHGKVGQIRLFLLSAFFCAVLGQWAFLQPNSWRLPLGLFLYSAAAFLLWKMKPWKITKTTEEISLSPFRERWLFLFILALAGFLRIYDLGRLPAGLFVDQGYLGLGALKILHEGWRPWGSLPFVFCWPLAFYQLSAWFCVFPATQWSLCLFFASLSLAAFPLVYWTFRQLTGPRTALLALFFLAIMRWHFHFSRNGFLGIQTPLYLFGTLAFLLYGFKSRKFWAFAVAAIFFAMGFYTYQSYKAFPLLLLVCLAYEWLKNRKSFQANRKNLLAFALITVFLAAPVVAEWIQQGSLGTRESQAFIGTRMVQENSLDLLWEKLVQTAGLFTLHGDEHPRHNLPGHRMLDDFTGILFVLGFFYALRNLQQRADFYALAGLIVMCLPGFLAVEQTEAHRLLGATPFIAFLAARFLTRVEAAEPLGKSRKPIFLALCLLLLAAAAFQNTRLYFVDQARNPDCWKSSSTEATLVGQALSKAPQTTYFVAPFFYYNYTLHFLDYSHKESIQELDLSSLPLLAETLPTGPIGFVLDGGKKPTLDLLESLYPGGAEEILRDPTGAPLAYIYTLPADQPRPANRLERGLRGEYFKSTPENSPPDAVRRDPLLNFTNIADFPLKRPPLWARWKGQLEIDKPGPYAFRILTSQKGTLFLDENPVGEGFLNLGRGSHPLRLELEPLGSGPEGTTVALHLLWKKPGQPDFELIPNSAWGKLFLKK